METIEEKRFNKYQTELTDEVLNDLPQEVIDQLYDIINNVEFVKRLISPKREYAKDRPRDSQGRIIVDLANPHILENTDYFRPTALHYAKYKTLTNLRPNANPNSEYYKWVKEEIRRCYEGYVRESDGEWVTGYLYFFLNYSPMMISKVRKKSKRADRIESLPEFWEGIYWRFHCLDQASNGGMYNKWCGGNNMAELASRGKGKSYSLASILTHLFTIGENDEAKAKVIGIVTAYQKEYLVKDGVLNKFIDMANFCASYTQFPRKRLKSSFQEMTWTMGYKDTELDIERGTQNSIIGVSSNDDSSKIRGKRAAKILIEEFGTFPRLVDLYNVLLPSVSEGDVFFGQIYMLGCVCAGTKVWTLDGRNINIEDLKKEDGIIGYSKLPVIKDNYIIHNNGITRESIGKIIEPVEKDCVKITLSNGNILMCSTDHPIFVQTKSSRRLCSYKDGNRRKTIFNESFVKANQLKVGDRVCECRKIDVFGNNTLFDSRLVGMLIGDGSYGSNETPKYSSEDRELLEYVKNKYDTSLSATHVTKKGNVYEDIRVKGICSYLKKIGIYGQVKQAKRLPSNYQTLTRNATIDLLSGLYDTDGTFYSKGTKSYIGLTQCNIEILKEVQVLWRKFGVICSIRKTNPRLSSNRKDKNPWFTLIINGADNLKLVSRVLSPIVTHKKESNQEILSFFDTYVPKKIKGYNKDYLVYKVVGIEDIGKQIVYNLSACTSRTYLANNIITHNTAGDKDSDFSGAQEIMYNPKGYNMYAIPNVYDKNNQGKPFFVFFFPGYVNRKLCYNKDGVSDVIKALIEILVNRYNVKYNSSDPNTIVKTIAEVPITPAEAIVKLGTNMFPVPDLTERVAQLDANSSEYNDVYSGDLIVGTDGNIEFKPTSAIPIRYFPHKDNKRKGAIEIFQMPKIDKQTGKPYSNRYILGCDPYDDDESNTMSLGSVFVLDLWTDSLVAEYTGRPLLAEYFYEICRKMCLFYNGRMNYESDKKGIFGYFSTRNSLYLFTDVLDFLKDKDMVKAGIGNKSKGTKATASINAYGRNLLRSWLLAPVTIIKTEDNKEVEVQVSRLYTIRNRALLRELITYNADGNFDRISAMGMLMLLRQDRMIMYKNNISAESIGSSNSSYLGNDPFFKNNYDLRNSKTVNLVKSN